MNQATNYKTVSQAAVNPLQMLVPEQLAGALAYKKAISYLRVSTRGQAMRGGDDKEGFSISAQREANKRKAATLGAKVVKEFVDRGASAKSADRGDLQDMLKYIREHSDIDYVVVHKVDRLARSRADDVAITNELKAAGIKLVSTSEAIDETPSGMLLHGIMASIAEFYSQNLATEVMKGLSQKVQNGGTVSRAALGYLNIRKVDEQGLEYRTVILDETRAPLIRLAFEMYATGDWSVSDLALYLADRGLTTRATPKVPARPIDKSALNKILLNPYYMGMVRFGGKYYKGKHQPLTDETTWQKVQEVLSSHICGERTREHPHFLKSTVYCGSCGERLIVQYAKSHTGVRYPYFSCAGRHNKRNECKQKSLLIDEVEKEIERLYENIEFGPKFRKELETWVLAEMDKAMRDFEQERQELEREKDKLQRKQKKLLETYYADAIPLELFKEEQDSIKSAVTSIDKRLDAHNTECADIRKKLGQALDLIEDCGKTYKTAPDSIKRAYNQALFDKILVFPSGETVPKFAEPYTVLFEQTAATDNAENTGGSVTEDGTATYPIAKAFEKTRNHEPSNFFGRGFSNKLLVGTTGFEPVTSWL